MRLRALVLRAIAAPLLALLSGCASTVMIDSEVRSFSQMRTLAPPVPFRFEQPLSRSAAQQAELETLALPPLQRVGLVRNDAAPRYSLRIEARTQPMVSPYATPYFGVGPLRGTLRWPGDPWHPWSMRLPEPSWTRHEVTLTLREIGSGQVAYETRAVSDGPWGPSPRILSTLVEAALQGFPAPPEGVRQVRIDTPLR
ncbi:MAG: hypothetical protein ACKOCJ_07620 [Burkholderiaceae bacterium]